MHDADRQHFNAMLTGFGLAGATPAFAQIASAEALKPEVLQLGPSGWTPNNSRRPVLLYRGGSVSARARDRPIVGAGTRG
jgi:hypothetical protein